MTRRRKSFLLGYVAMAVTAVGAMVPFVRFASYYVDETRTPRVVCLLYHKLVTPEEFDALRGDDRLYAISTQRFEEHLRRLRDEHYRALSTDECLAFLRGRLAVTDKCVYVSFDDGYDSTLRRAAPLLKQYSFRAAVFVTADANADVFSHGTPRQRRLSDAELRSLDPDVFDVQAHGLTHRPLSRLSDVELLNELTRSRTLLESIRGRPVRAMAIPGNHYDARVLHAAREAGYDAVFTSDPGSLHAGDDPIGLPRVNVAGYFTAEGLTSILDPWAMAKRRFHHVARR